MRLHRRTPVLVYVICAILLASAAGCAGEPTAVPPPVAKAPTTPPTALPYPGVGAGRTPAVPPSAGAYPDPATRPPAATPAPTDAPLPLFPVTPLPTRTPLPAQNEPSGPPPEDLATLLYAVSTGDTAEVWALSLDTAARVRGRALVASGTTNDWFYNLLLNPSGTRAAADMYYWRGGPGVASIVDLERGTVEPIEREGTLVSGSPIGWEGGGDLLLFAEPSPGGPAEGWALFRVDLASGEFQEIDLTPPGYNFGSRGGAAPDPAGRRLVYAWNWREQPSLQDHADLWILDLETGEQTPIGSVDGAAGLFSWSPDGTRIALAIGTAGTCFTSQLAILDIGAGEMRVIGSAEGWPSFAWSPDGARIAFLRHDHDAGFESEWGSMGVNVYLLDVTSGSVRRLTNLEGMSLASVTWLPGGESLVLSATDLRDGAAPPEIWLLDVASGEMHALARAVQRRSPLAWLPSGD